MQSSASTVAAYLASLPDDRRAEIEKVRNVILKSMDAGFAETMQYGMIGYNIPHSTFPAGYHCDPKQPLPYAGLASQKNGLSLYLMGLYIGSTDDKPTAHAKAFHDGWKKTGKKLDMGKACIRFKKADDLALDVIADAFKRLGVKEYIALYLSQLPEKVRAKMLALNGQAEPQATRPTPKVVASQAKAAKKSAVAKKPTKKPAKKTSKR